MPRINLSHNFLTITHTHIMWHLLLQTFNKNLYESLYRLLLTSFASVMKMVYIACQNMTAIWTAGLCILQIVVLVSSVVSDQESAISPLTPGNQVLKSLNPVIRTNCMCSAKCDEATWNYKSECKSPGFLFVCYRSLVKITITLLCNRCMNPCINQWEWLLP